jgi:hypothetical protein
MQVTEQQEERLQALLQQRATHRLEARSIGDLLNDWNEAVSEAQSHAPEEDSVSYIDLIAALNHRLAKRIVKDINFQTFANDTIDELPSTGVENWPKFVGSLMEGGLIAEGDSILRIRTVSPSGKIKFLNGRLRKVTDEQVLVGIMLSGDGSETLVDVEDLAAESRAAIARGDRPVITPCADMRIFFNLGFSRSIVLYDGAPYQRVMKSVTALREGRILDNPREPKLHSYSPLWQHNPGDMNDPWKGLCEKYSTVDYYALGVEDDESKVKLQWAQ